MRPYTNKHTFKKIAIVLVIVSMFNFVMPNYSHASIGGALFDPLAQFVCFVADQVIKFTQWIFIGESEIALEIPTGELENNQTYSIKYAPGKIFSGTVPGLDINFINPMDASNLWKESIVAWDIIENPNFDEIGITSDLAIFNQKTKWQQDTIERPRGDPNDPRCNRHRNCII